MGSGLELSLLQIFLPYDKKLCGIPGNVIYLDYQGEWNMRHHPQELQLNPESAGNIRFSEFSQIFHIKVCSKTERYYNFSILINFASELPNAFFQPQSPVASFSDRAENYCKYSTINAIQT